MNLELDQLLTLYPDTDSPFQNEMDVLQRLLPYHIYQHPRHDLDKMRGLKGKAKATEVDLLREGIQGRSHAVGILIDILTAVRIEVRIGVPQTV